MAQQPTGTKKGQRRRNDGGTPSTGTKKGQRRRSDGGTPSIGKNKGQRRHSGGETPSTGTKKGQHQHSGGETPAAAAAGKGLIGTAPVEPGREYETDIVGMNEDGEGVGRINGFTLFVQGALPGERVLAKVDLVKKQYGHAQTVRLLKRSPDRVAPPCRIYEACGGCQLQHLGYEAQLRQKRQTVADALQRIGKFTVSLSGQEVDGGSVGAVDRQSVAVEQMVGSRKPANALTPIVVHETAGMREPWRYRNKAQVPFGQREGGLVGGFYAQGSHEIIEFDACAIQDERNDAAVAAVKRAAREFGVSGYDASSSRGVLRHVIAKTAVRTGEVMIVLVTNGSFIPNREPLLRKIRQLVPGVTSICQSVNTDRSPVVMGSQTRVLWGEPVIHDKIGDIAFAISARSFYQVNPVQTEVLYGQALTYAALTGKETVIDAYCGIGTISLFLARHAKKVYGVEIVPEAIADAKANAALNGIRNVEFAVGKAETVLPAWKKAGITPDVVVVDPPRSGCDRALLSTLLRMQPKRIVYVSCNPATLARDLRTLADGGYQPLEVRPVDMFPHTVHVECVVSLVYKGFE